MNQRKYTPVVMSFAEIKREYKNGKLPKSEYWRFREMISLEAAIEAAVLSEDENRKIYPHQLKKGKPVADFHKAAEAVRPAQEGIDACRNFDELHNRIDKELNNAFPGHKKELYTYDIAFRIASYYDGNGNRSGMLPTRVYLHCGTRKGAEALGIDTSGKKSISISELPPDLRSLPAWQLEDILCEYKDHFPPNWNDNNSN